MLFGYICSPSECHWGMTYQYIVQWSWFHSTMHWLQKYYFHGISMPTGGFRHIHIVTYSWFNLIIPTQWLFHVSSFWQQIFRQWYIQAYFLLFCKTKSQILQDDVSYDLYCIKNHIYICKKVDVPNKKKEIKLDVSTSLNFMS